MARGWEIGLALAAACQGGDVVKDTPVAPADAAVTFELTEVGPDPAAAGAFAEGLVDRADVQAWAEGHRIRLMRFELLPIDGGAGAPIIPTSRFIAVFFDYDANRAFAAVGDMAAPDALTFEASPERLPPTLDEYQEAIDMALQDPQTASDHAAGRIEFFQAMPPTIDSADGHRVISLGIRPTDTTETGEIAGADLSGRRIIHFERRTPSNARVGGFVCNPPPTAPQQGPGRGAPGWAQLRMVQQGVEIWSMYVRRPASSGGAQGSGVELYDVRYRGKPMLQRAHVPILNVLYDQNACGPYRDWQYQENPFTVGNTLLQVAGGIRVVDWAKTMRETRDDNGNFSGVAAFWDPVHQEAVLVSELEAGWYRYISEWRFGLDGTIQPRWGFDAVQNWCTCQTHTHHAYWRLDFALGAGANRVEELDASGAWQLAATEAQRTRDDAANRHWRVSDAATGDAVLVQPRPGEDPPDAYGIADVWLLRGRASEVDDSRVATDTQAGLPAWVNGESLVDTDVVMWWGGHFLHNDADPSTNQTHTVGLTITPERW